MVVARSERQFFQKQKEVNNLFLETKHKSCNGTIFLSKIKVFVNLFFLWAMRSMILLQMIFVPDMGNPDLRWNARSLLNTSLT